MTDSRFPDLSRRDVIRLTAASLVPAVFTRSVFAETTPLPTADADEGGVSVLKSHFSYGSSARRLMATPGMIDACHRMLDSGDVEGVTGYGKLKESQAKTTAELRKALRDPKPAFTFATRSMLLETTLGFELLDRRGDATQSMRDEVVGATTDLVAALQKAGNKTLGYHVGQGSNMMPLAVAYDVLYPHFSDKQRKAIVAALLDYSVRPTLEALYGLDDRAWWIKDLNNWTTICIGGAIAAVLALREADDPGPFTIRPSKDTPEISRPYADHAGELIFRGAKNLDRCWVLLESNNGLWGEGPGYQHDAMLPLYLTVLNLESALRRPGEAPPVLKDFVAHAKQAATLHVNSGLHLASPIGHDFAYSDGIWSLTDHAINFLIADYARQAGGTGWQAAAWQAAKQNGKLDLATNLLYRAAFAPANDRPGVPGMAGFDINTAAKSIYFYSHKAVIPGKEGVVSNPHLVIWRQSWTDPNSAAVLFKGGDNRRDFHSHLDVGTFVYDSQGVRWAVPAPMVGGYPLYRRDGGVNSGPLGYTHFQLYPKRACGHNTLVLNPADNAYTRREAPEPWAWLWQINPDQAAYESDCWSPVSGFETDPANDVWRATIDLVPAYGRYGVQAGTRAFEFDRKNGEFTITDRIEFAKTGNDVRWFMHVDASTVPVFQDATSMVLAATRADKTPVFLKLQLISAAPASHAALKYGPIDTDLPAGQPADEWLWAYTNVAKHKRYMRKISLHLRDVSRDTEIAVKLIPLPAFAGKSPAEVAANLLMRK